MARLQTARIVSDGTPKGTKVFDAEGKEIKGIVSLVFRIDASEDMGVLAVSFLCPAADVIGELDTP